MQRITRKRGKTFKLKIDAEKAFQLNQNKELGSLKNIATESFIISDDINNHNDKKNYAITIYFQLYTLS